MPSASAVYLEVQVTELDLSVYAWGDTSCCAAFAPERHRRQAEAYGAPFNVSRERPGPDGSPG